MKLNATLLALLQQAVGFHQAGDLGRARTLFNQALRIDPRQPDALHYLGRARVSERRPKKRRFDWSNAAFGRSQIPGPH